MLRRVWPLHCTCCPATARWRRPRNQFRSSLRCPGSPGDIMTHLFTEQMEQAFRRTRGPTIVLEPRRAADGTLGTEDVSHASPDGNTLLLTTNAFVINPYLRAVRYDPLTNFEPICYLVVRPKSLSSTMPRLTTRLLNSLRGPRQAGRIDDGEFRAGRHHRTSRSSATSLPPMWTCITSHFLPRLPR